MKCTREEIEKLENTWYSSRSMYIGWVQLQRLLKYCLSDIIERDIWPAPEAIGEKWFIPTIGYTEEEITKLLDAVNADKWERKYHMRQLERSRSRISTSLAIKLISSELPFTIEKTKVYNGGVIFFSPGREYVKKYRHSKGSCYDVR